MKNELEALLAELLPMARLNVLDRGTCQRTRLDLLWPKSLHRLHWQKEIAMCLLAV